MREPAKRLNLLVMTNTLTVRSIAAMLLAVFGLGLVACDQVEALSEPTYRIVVGLDREALEDRDLDAGQLDAATQSTIEVISRRIDATGGAGHRVSDLGKGRLAVDFPGSIDPQTAKNLLGITAKLEIKLVDVTALPTDVAKGVYPPGSEIVPMRDGSGQVALKRLGGLRGKNISRAQVGYNESSNAPVVNVEFDEKGAKRFAVLTTANVGSPMAIVLDDEIISMPIIAEPIVGGQVQISGGFTQDAANELAIMLNSGALPVPLVILEERTLGN